MSERAHIALPAEARVGATNVRNKGSYFPRQVTGTHLEEVLDFKYVPKTGNMQQACFIGSIRIIQSSKLTGEDQPTFVGRKYDHWFGTVAEKSYKLETMTAELNAFVCACLGKDALEVAEADPTGEAMFQLRQELVDKAANKELSGMLIMHEATLEKGKPGFDRNTGAPVTPQYGRNVFRKAE